MKRQSEENLKIKDEVKSLKKINQEYMSLHQKNPIEFEKLLK